MLELYAYLFFFATYLRAGDRGDPARFPSIMQHRARAAVTRVLERERLTASWGRM